MCNMTLLPQEFYKQDTVTVAKELLGKVLCIRHDKGEIQKCRIVEVEAYLGTEDAACHTFGDRRTERTKSMYLDGGHVYVYFIYGMYYCLNVVTRSQEHPEAVLIRAVEPLPQHHPPLKKKDMKTNGPGKLCKFYNITREDDGARLWKRNSDLFLMEDSFEVLEKQIVACPRIGVDYAGEAAGWPLRFYLKDNPYVSRQK